mmetsp:Transcript_17849/g.25234  ORF Transcript_17849/g.25234 Transcript_17849/m.25234 type:complete len:151 (-) Transcript_17849:519-971(-)
MSYHDGSHTGMKIFLNKENLAFALPLISLCSTYAFFKYIPLEYGLPALGSVVFFYKLVSSIKARAIEKKEEKIASLDEDLLKELAADDLMNEERNKQKATKKKKKADDKVRQRLAAEKKKYEQSKDDEEDDDDADYGTFAKGKNGKKKIG